MRRLAVVDVSMFVAGGRPAGRQALHIAGRDGETISRRASQACLCHSFVVQLWCASVRPKLD
jgi:hypothetical protein